MVRVCDVMMERAVPYGGSFFLRYTTRRHSEAISGAGSSL
ncbi:hypothetical protein CHCC20335_4614 [Bacillus paralicheniformis]|nr:hypothetical protein CHCC20335_4614 [Bacillus paralicheniformis]